MSHSFLLCAIQPLIQPARVDVPALPFNVSAMEADGIKIPVDIKATTGYREFFEMLSAYAREKSPYFPEK